MKTQHLLFCLFGVMILTNVAYADVNFGKKVPSADDVINALNPSKANPSAISATPEDADYEGDVKKDNSRSIDMSKLDAKPSSTKSRPAKPKPIPMPPSSNTEAALSMEIIFGYNSAELTATAKEQLRPVGEALASGKLSNLSFVVEGHTDGVGGQAYNKTLSEERAASVKSFLVTAFNLPSTNIQIVGKGKSDLLDPNNPSSEVNRRVRIIARK
ncbi:MAG: OmpA family protein [Methylococcales bacterium]|nr:OmpA family protein [Methylococcales bacterium]